MELTHILRNFLDRDGKLTAFPAKRKMKIYCLFYLAQKFEAEKDYTEQEINDEKCFIARYIKKDGKEAYEEFKQTLIGEINALGIPGMPKINELYALVGNSSTWNILSTADRK